VQRCGGQLAWATRFDKNGWIRNQRLGQKHLDNCLKVWAGHTWVIALKLGILIGQLSGNRFQGLLDSGNPLLIITQTLQAQLKGFPFLPPKYKILFLSSYFHFYALSTRRWFISGELLPVLDKRQLRFKYKNSWLKFIHFHNWIVWLGNC